MKAIPKKIHIIWLGGDIPQANRSLISTFPLKNPEYEINLWYDSLQMLTKERGVKVKAAHGGTVKWNQWKDVANEVGAGGGDVETIIYLNKHHQTPIEELINNRESCLGSIKEFCKKERLKIRDVQTDLKIGKNGPYYLQELANRGANFGSASDILRIEILLQCGGIYFDTDVECVEGIGELICHQSYPRFSTAHPVWATGVTKAEWKNDDWWKSKLDGQLSPPICNSIIASHAGCKGLKSYKDLINRNFQGLKKSTELRDEYLMSIDDERKFEKHTIKNTGPTAARDSTGFGKATMSSNAAAAWQYQHELKIEMRDNWYFPMYCVVDKFLHDWKLF
jgi:hypothetical protein